MGQGDKEVCVCVQESVGAGVEEGDFKSFLTAFGFSGNQEGGTLLSEREGIS